MELGTGKVFVSGSANVDFFVACAAFPRPGETILGRDFSLQPGGKGLNQAVAASRAGSGTIFSATVGADAHADFLSEVLSAENLVACLGRAAQPTGCAIIMVDAEGENAIVVVPGANSAHSALADFEAADSVSVVVANAEVPVSDTTTLFLRAKQRGAVTIFNAAPAVELPDSLWKTTDYLVVNEKELAFYVKRDPETFVTTGPVISAAREMPWRAALGTVVTLGERGAVLVTPDRVIVIPAPRVTAVDTTGAGDCFVGYFASGLSAGRGAHDSMEIACRAASVSVTRRGAMPSIPYLREIRPE